MLIDARKCDDKRIAVVTGANKGIGLEISKQLASNEVFLVLTARDNKRGLEAVENLKLSGVNNAAVNGLIENTEILRLPGVGGQKYGLFDLIKEEPHELAED
ncbi:(+)-neomenthol dehydrogenase [Acorus calamus]|uniref:(+)-neomenthol dehydrogenase n=1 Tax=Acorus calamus TaxID=4465 RepID=A0AAV9E3J8_ACOCL|nr:(+)-neomenthol dehydrogenase [Acorus calamus]